MARQTHTLIGEPRERVGSKYAARLRRSGKLPAVIYGHQQDPAHIAVDLEQFTELLEEGAHLVEVRIGADRAETCLIKDLQYDHLGDTIIHTDLTRVDLSEEVEVAVSIVLKGEEEAPGLKEAHVLLEQPLTDLEIRCRADAIPEQIEVDVSGMNVEDVITVADLILPEGVKATASEDTAVVAIRHSRIADELEGATEGAEAEAGAEPEVIGEKDDEESGD